MTPIGGPEDVAPRRPEPRPLTWIPLEEAVPKRPAPDEPPRPLTEPEIERFRERKGPGWCPCMMYRFPWECDCDTPPTDPARRMPA